MKPIVRNLTALAALLALGLSACGTSTPATSGSSSAPGVASDPDASISIGSMTPPVNLDNIGGGGQGVTEALYRNVYEPVLTLEEDGTISPGIASDVAVSDDGLTYTFTIRQGVSFHSGKALTAEDVKYSFERVISPESKSARKKDLSVISEVTVADASTVVVNLTQRAQSFRYNSSYVWVVPAGATDLATNTDGTGPYRLTDYQPGTSLTLTRFDDYWGPAPSNAEVVFHYYTSETAQTNALKSGQIDVITNVSSPEQVKSFQDDPDFTISEGRSTTKQVLAWNDRRPPFDQVAVRKALHQAIDNEAIRQATWDTYGELIGSFVPPQDPWYEDLTGIDPYDPTAAKQALDAAGYPSGFTFTLVTPSTDVHQVSAQAIKADLAKVGVTVNIELIDPSAWYAKVYQSRDFDATLQEHVNDRDLVWYGNPDFYWGYDNPQVTQWVSQAEAAATEQEQIDLYKKIARQIAEDAASDWLYLYPQLRVSSSDVSGYSTDGKNSAFYVAEITKKP